jgi:hypothetical protein
MAISVRDTGVSCMGLTPPFSVRSGIYGYIFGPTTRDLRLDSHLKLIKGKSINLSLILVAHENDFSGEWTLAEAQSMQEGIDRARELYGRVNLGIRKLYWQFIPVADAGGYASVDAGEATDLTNDWSGANDGIDVFFVTTVTDASGWSNTDGPCDKDEDKERTGVVMELGGGTNIDGIVLGHEVGHYLHLQHAGDITNIMGDDSDGDGIGSIDGTSTNITTAQGNTMKGSCFVKSTC